MDIGDIIYQLFLFMVLIGLVSGIIFIFKYLQQKLNLMKEINSKLDRLIEEKQKD
ncbi:DUF4083 family protein [Pseudalkalibacillus sp. SCS-8]|uniref:DUF4083 family protein n=1 Tax=Pseudalkalibacillus nanhaiensis TaxID=3115291 RepID=UPI0032DA7E40